jgi:hypothetical protein
MIGSLAGGYALPVAAGAVDLTEFSTGSAPLAMPVMPAGRGSNSVRLIYEGATTVGATVLRFCRYSSQWPHLVTADGIVLIVVWAACTQRVACTR